VKYLFSIILFVLIQGFCLSQTITFDKEFNFYVFQVEQISDGDYIVGGYLYSILIVARLDKSGYIKWVKEFQHTDFTFNRLILLPINDGFFVNLNVYNNDNNKFNVDAHLVKMNYEGDILFEKNFGKPYTDDSGYQIIEADAGNYFFLTDTLLYKINPSGDIIWEKQAPYSVLGVNYLKYFMTKFSDNFYLLLDRYSLKSMDNNGNTLWVKQFPPSRVYFPIVMKGKDGNILIFFKNNMMKVSTDGEVLQEITLKNSGYTNYAVRMDNKIFLLYDVDPESKNSSLIILESDSIIVSEQNLPIDAVQLIPTNDNGFLFSGNKNNLSWLMKTDPRFDRKSVTIKYPVPAPYSHLYEQVLFPRIYGFQDYLITWESSGVNKINLDYSSDAGKTWINIASNLTCDSSAYSPYEPFGFSYPYFVWSVPEVISDQFYLRVTDSEDHLIFDRTDPIGSCIIYQQYDTIAANEILMWIGNNGMGSHDPRTDGSGFYWPGGDSASISAIFTDGLVWGGKVNGEIRVNGDTYRYGLQPGRILGNGTADNPLSTQSKIFKIRKDWQTLPESNLKDRLEYDYNHWPIDAGAPWDDVNEDGVFTKGIDKPKFIGDETLFYVANDLDTAITRSTYGSNPIGLEFQTTIFGFNREDLKDVVFKKYKVINKSNVDITDMYLTYWADVDMGDANDDLSAFDSTYNMAYVYNFDNDDGYGYYGTPPPAIAHMIVQGPIIPSIQTDCARFDDGWRTGYKNLGMTSSGLIVKSGVIYPNDPELGVYAGTTNFYNLMKGLNNDGSYIIDPLTNETTIWPLTGDPVTATGWYLVYPGMNYGFDQRYHVPTGPFNLAVGDTQEVVYAIVMARGTDNINSITKLRELAAHVQEFYNTELVDILNTKQNVAPTGYTLFQNYPNPFNPKTNIEYEVPEKSLVTIKIYDILGREVQTLVNKEEKVRWRYKVVFDASTLASGVYFYRLQAGSFTETKKMILLK
jgi:hypothetical protein